VEASQPSSQANLSRVVVAPEPADNRESCSANPVGIRRRRVRAGAQGCRRRRVREQLVELFLDNLRRWRAGEPLRNIVDKDLGYVPNTQEESP